ncbi:hypothetical protein ABPG72_006016 [Tetrahymena utriculariae]
MNIQSLGALVMSRKRNDLPEEEKIRRKNMIEQNKKIQKKETQRLYSLLESQNSDRNAIDADSFVNIFGSLNFFKEYIQEGNKQLIRQVFMKADLQTFYKNQFITRKGEKNNQFMLILEGQVGLYLEVADQLKPSKKQLILIKKLIQGDPIEIGSLIDGQNYLMTTQALSDTVQILSMNTQNFSKTFQKYESDKFDADLNFLKGVPFISDWPRKNLTSLQMCITKYTVPRSQIIYQEGQPSHALFIVKKGEFGQYKKRQFWQRNENIDKGEPVDINEKLNRIEEIEQKTSDQKQDQSGSSTPISKQQTLLRGLSKQDVFKKVAGFLVGSVVEMNSDLLQTFTVFDSFGEKELLNQSPRQSSVVCRSPQGELIQIKSRHFFIIAQEDHELKYQVMTKMMVDSKKSELKNLRSGLSFRNENELLLFDKNLSNIEEIEDKINLLQTTGSISSTLGNHPYNHDSMQTNLQQPNKSGLNKIQFNPNQSLSSSNKQSTAHIYFEHRHQSKKFENTNDQILNNVKANQMLQPQRKSVLITDLTQYLHEKQSQTPTALGSIQQNKHQIVANKYENPGHQNIQLMSNGHQKNQISNFLDSNSISSKNKIESLQEIDSQYNRVIKLPAIQTNNTISQNTNSYLNIRSQNQFRGNSFSNTFDRQYGGSLTPNHHVSSKNNLNIRKSFNFGGDYIYEQQKSPFDQGKNSHLDIDSGLPSNKYSSRPLISQISYSQYQVNI